MALGVLACSDDSSTTTTGSTGSTGSTASTRTTEATAAITPTDDTARLIDTEFGPAIADGEGLVLYAFDEDTAGTPTCVDAECTAKWPPVIVEGEPTIGEGLDAAMFTVVDRPDGTKQLAVSGKPLYTMADDTPGTALCQGGGEVWWLVNADGTVNKTV
jgi:predicted lipoprotein with Yx(FWY)xxD motif